MKKWSKILIIGLLLCTVGVFSASAKGNLRVGLEFGNPTAVIIIRPSPLDFKIGYSFVGDQYLFLSADYRIISGYQLIDFLHIFLGAGAYTEIHFEGEANVGFGGRIPLGLQAFLLNSVIEIFLEICPTVEFVPTLGFGGLQGWIGFTIRI